MQTVDVGCGIGGSSRHIARRYGSGGRGITLSPVQAERANALTQEAGLADRLSFQVADALDQPFADGEPDLWFPFAASPTPLGADQFNLLDRELHSYGLCLRGLWCASL